MNAIADATAPPERDGLIRCVGIMLIILGAVRLGIAAYTGFRIPASVLESNSIILLQVIVVPAILGIGTFAAGIMTFLRIETTRVLSIVICTVCLVYQFYVIASVLAAIVGRPGTAVSMVFWIVSPAYVLMYGFALTCLVRWQPQPPPSS